MGAGDVSLTVVALVDFEGVETVRSAFSAGNEVTGDLVWDGVLFVLIAGDDSALSNCSRSEATPAPTGFGDDGVGETSRVEGDWERGCKIGVCWVGFDRLPLDGVTAADVAAAAVVEDVRLEREAVDADGDDGTGSVLATRLGDAFSTETYENKMTDVRERRKQATLSIKNETEEESTRSR